MFAEEFWERALAKRLIDPVTGCWLWSGALSLKGYGVMIVRGFEERVHRLAAQFSFGWQARNWKQSVCHHCDVPNCFNPQHLYVGNAKTNGRDQRLKHRLTLEQRQVYWRDRGYVTPDLTFDLSEVEVHDHRAALVR